MTCLGRIACTAWLIAAVGAIGCGEVSSEVPGADSDAAGSDPSFGARTVVPEGSLNEAPTGTITSPSEGQVIQVGDPVSFAAVVGDLESARETLSVQWLSNLSGLLHQATANEAGSTTFESSELLAGAHTITLVVVDEGGGATEVKRNFTINGPPGQAQVRLEPSVPATGDDLHAIIVTDAEDPNRASSELNYHYTWFRDDELKQTSSTVLASQTAKGQLWRVEVRANDGMVDGLTSSAEVVIGNTAPSCPTTVILPAAGNTSETFTCTCPNREDADSSDPAEDTCSFSNDGVWIADGCTLPSEATTKGMTLTCTVTPHDGEDTGDAVTSIEAPVMNSLPSSPEVALSPVEGPIDTLFSCEVISESTDLDGDTVTYQYTWYVNGYANPGTSSPTVLASALWRDSEGTAAGGGDQIFCRVVGDDNAGGLSNPSDTQVISLLNSPPSGGAVVISPPTATEADILTCVATEATDPDGQVVLWSYEWFREDDEGAMVAIIDATGEALTGADFNRDDVVSCAATPTDGVSPGDPVDSKNLVTITNSLPTLEGASLTPPLVDAYGAFTCAGYGWNDLDGDPEEVAYAWWVVIGDAQAMLAGKVESTLDAATLAPGELVRCQVTPKNGQALGQAVLSTDGEVMNDPPSLDDVTLTPGEPTVASTLVCAPSGYSDLEGGGPNYLYTWRRNNEDVIGATHSTLTEGFAKGDVIRCVVTPNDGIDDGPSVPSNEVIILNIVPQIGSVSVTPNFATPCETLSCDVADVNEPDEADTLTYAYRWELNGGPISPVTKSLSAAAYAPNDTLRCYVKPTDGSFKPLPNGGITTVWGDEAQSNIGTIVNTPPTVASISIGPPEPQVGDILTCAPEGFDDADCNPPALFHFIWYLNGEVVDAADGPTLSLDFVTTGAKLQCQAIPDDGYTQGSGKLSAVLTVTNAPPTDAVVTIDAPEGSTGDITCDFQVEPTDSDPLSYTWFWQINDQTEVVGEQALPAGSTSDCDLVQCRVEVTDGLATTNSNVASLNLPVGEDCDDGNLCTSHGCLPEGGCATNPNTSECDDGDPCTNNDTCSEGSCLGQPDECDDVNLCTVDSCHPATGCVHSYDPSVCDDQNPCTSDLCDLVAGSCVNTVLEDDTLCDGDGDGCTQADSCFAGTCIVGAAVDCPGEPDVCQHQVCESLSPQAHICKTVYSVDSVSCEDGLQCTTADHCNGSGTCVPGAYLDCSPGAGPCQLGSCVEGAGCTFVDSPDGNACNSDNDGCTSDTCSDGLCLPGASVDCSLEGGPCKLGFCESSSPSTYQCAFVPTLLGSPCNTGDFCYIDAACDGEGECDGGTLRDCEAEVGSVCHTGYCDSQAEVCIPIKAADGYGCDDGSNCTITDSCVNGYCQGSGDACREERLSVALSGASKPDVADLGYGRYVVQYAGSADEVGGKVYDYIRLNDAYGSREDEEHEIAGEVLASSNQTLTQFTTPTAVAPNGNFLTTSWTANGCSCDGVAPCTCETGELVVRSFDYLGDQLAENLSLVTHLLEVDGSGAVSGETALTQIDLDTLAFPDGSWALFKIATLTSSQTGSGTTASTTTNAGLTYTPLSQSLLPGTPVELIARAKFTHKRLFDIVTLPDTTEFLVVWVQVLYKLGQPKWDQLYVQRFSTLGVPLTSPKLIYENKLPDLHSSEAMEARYIEATGELIIVWDDQHPSLSGGLRRVRWLWSSIEGEMVGSDTYTAFDEGLGNQRLADISVFSDGGFVLTWDDDAGDVDGFSAKARVFEVDGNPTCNELALNRNGIGDQAFPGVAVLASDEWVTAFADDSGSVWTRRYDRDGVDAVGQLERTANASTAGAQKELSGAQAQGGDLFLAWTSPYAGNSGSEIVGRRIDSAGASITAETQINTTMSGVQSHPSVAALNEGWLVLWQSAGSGALGMEVTARWVDATGAPTGAEITVPSQNQSDQTRPMVASLGDGAMAVWESNAVTPGSSSDIHGRILSQSGEGLGEDILISSGTLSYHPAIAAFPDGSGYIVAWETNEGSDWDVYLRHLDHEGTPQGDAVIAHQTTQLDQGNAAVAVGPNGYLITCVETTTNFGATAVGVSCQRITKSGLELIGPELTPSGLGSSQARPAVDYLTDGSWVVAWDSEDIDGDLSGVQLRRYSAFGVPMGQRIVANRTWEGAQSHPVILPIDGPLNALIVGWRHGDASESDVVYRVMPGL